MQCKIPLTNASPAPVVSTGLTLTPETLPLNACIEILAITISVTMIHKAQKRRHG